jgi:hypothetical protein
LKTTTQYATKADTPTLDMVVTDPAYTTYASMVRRAEALIALQDTTTQATRQQHAELANYLLST